MEGVVVMHTHTSNTGADFSMASETKGDAIEHPINGPSLPLLAADSEITPLTVVDALFKLLVPN